jgi:hypothetical protein
MVGYGSGKAVRGLILSTFRLSADKLRGSQPGMH